MAFVSCLVDTNILVRIARRFDPQHKSVDKALARLAEQGTMLHYTHQNIAELWNVMTRPVASNGLGLSAAETDQEVRAIEVGMSLLPDSGGVYREWRRIVVKHKVFGVRVHDAPGSGHVCSWRQSHPHAERGRFQPLRGPHRIASR